MSKPSEVVASKEELPDVTKCFIALTCIDASFQQSESLIQAVFQRLIFRQVLDMTSGRIGLAELLGLNVDELYDQFYEGRQPGHEQTAQFPCTRKFKKLRAMWAFYRAIRTYKEQNKFNSLAQLVKSIQESSEEPLAKLLREE